MLDSYCRLCGESSKNLTNILTENKKPLDIYGRIRITLQISINKEDELSHSVCNQCINSLQTFNNFIKKCQAIQFRLHEVDNFIEVEPKIKCRKRKLSETEKECSGSVSSMVIPEGCRDKSNIIREESSRKDWDGCSTEPTIADDCCVLSKRKPAIPYSKSLSFLSSKVQNKSEETLKKSKIGACSANNADTPAKELGKGNVAYDKTVLAMSRKETLNDDTEPEKASKNEVDCVTKKRKSAIPYSKLLSFFTSKVQSKSEENLKNNKSGVCSTRKEISNADIPAEKENSVAEERTLLTTAKKVSLHNEEGQEKSLENENDGSCDKYEISDDLFSKSISLSKRGHFSCGDSSQISSVSCPLCCHEFVFCEIKDHLRFHSDDQEYLDEVLTELTEIPAKHKSHFCKECKKIFVRDSLFTEHLNEHANNRILRCHLCENKFLVRSKLKVHVRAVHVVKSNKCDSCDYAAKHASDLQKHIRSIHGQQYLICEVCGKSVSCNISNYNRHLQTHSEDRPYKCDVCDVRYKTAATLKRHRENKHFPYSVLCTTCGTICGSKMKYVKHVKKCKKKGVNKIK